MTLNFLTAGESHGPALVAILEGIPAGLQLETSHIDRELLRRQQGFGAGGRMKIEKDTVRILSGVMGGKTTGAPISFLVQNDDHQKWKGKAVPAMTTPRPGHADLTGAVKYGYRDMRPALERSSARETAMRVACGSVCKQLLSQFGILVGGYVRAIGGISSNLDGISLVDRIRLAEQNEVRCPDSQAAEKIHARIEEIIRGKDTLGGILEIFVLGLPIGLGSFSQWNKRLEARLGAAVLSVQAIKGVEIGEAWENAQLPGTKAHDAIKLEGGSLVRPTNRAGGIEGGVSNGEPIILRAAMKPIATTLTPQITVDLASGEQGPTKYERSDFCPVPRAVPILESMVAFVVADALLEKLGGDSMEEITPRFESLRQAKLSDLPMDNIEHVFWE
jgi:chorismate synthase